MAKIVIYHFEQEVSICLIVFKIMLYFTSLDGTICVQKQGVTKKIYLKRWSN